jgi:CHAD domain-containing protein
VAGDLQLVEMETSKSAARSWRSVIDARVARRSATLAGRLHDAGAVYLPERLHGVRIAVKKLRYALELANEVAPARARTDLTVLKRAQELLGRIHDLQVLVDRVRQVQASLAPPNVAVWRELDGVMATLEDDCRRLHARYVRMRGDLAALTARFDPDSAVPPGRAARRAG